MDSHDQSRRFKVLADRNRVKMLLCLKQGPKVVGEIVNCVKVERTSTSHHLKVLREEGLVIATKIGRRVKYELASGLVIGTFFDFGCCKIEFPALEKNFTR